MHDDVIFALAGIGLISIACQWIAWRVKLQKPFANADSLFYWQIQAGTIFGLRVWIDLRPNYGNVVSEHADQHLDLIGIGRLLVLSEYPETNLIACLACATKGFSRL